MVDRADDLSTDALEGTEIRELLLGEAAGRLAAARAEMRGPAPDLAALGLALHSLKGLLAQVGASELAAHVHALEDDVDLPERHPRLVTGLDEIAAVLGPRPPSVGRTVAARDVVDAVATELSRVARRRGRLIDIEVSSDAELEVVAGVAGVLVDAAGHVARNAVVHADAPELHVTVSLTRRDGGVVLAITDSGRPSANRSQTSILDVDHGRGRGRAAAAARLDEVGGHLEMLVGPAGLNVRLVIPDSGNSVVTD